MKKQLLTGALAFSTLTVGALMQASPVKALDLTGATTSGSVNGAYFERVPNNGVPAGTGNINSFVRLQSPGNATEEEGYNTDGRPLRFDENNSPQFTRSLKLSDIPIIDVAGILYRQFILDINEPNASQQDPDLPKVDLTELQLFLGNAGNLLTANNTPFAGFGSNAYSVFDLDGAGEATVNLFDFNPGSGRYDLFAYIPDSLFTGPNEYVYLYSKFTGAEGGFEEWAVGTPNTVPVPTPALLPGLIGMGIAALRKKKQAGEATQEA